MSIEGGDDDGLNWLRELGVDVNKLPPDALKVALEQGEKGVKEMMKEAENNQWWRGRPVPDQERLNRAKAVQTLGEQGGGHWDKPDKIGDKPTTWIQSEIDDLTKPK